MTDLLRLKHLAFVREYEEDGAVIIEAKSREAKLPPPCCLLQSLDRNGTKRQRYRDHPVQSRTAWVEVKRQRFRCSECGATHYEILPDIDADRRLTVRFREHLERQSVEHSFTTAATINGVHETLIRRLFDDYSERTLRAYIPKMPRVLGMDEIYLHGRARFVIGDVENRAMIDMQPSRREIDLMEYLALTAGRDGVEVVCQDMWAGYRTITRKLMPKAVTVVDKYHVQRTANYGMEIVRKALYRDLSNKDRVALKRRRAVFLARWDACKPETRTTLGKLFGQYPALATAYDLKERFYDIYEAPDRAAAEAATDRWLASVPTEFERPFKPSIDAFKALAPAHPAVLRAPVHQRLHRAAERPHPAYERQRRGLQLRRAPAESDPEARHLRKGRVGRVRPHRPRRAHPDVPRRALRRAAINPGGRSGGRYVLTSDQPRMTKNPKNQRCAAW